MGELQKNPRMKLVYEDGRPSYFKETSCDGTGHQDSTGQVGELSQNQKPVATRQQSKPIMTASSPLAEADVGNITALTKAASPDEPKDEKCTAANPFLGPVEPQLDPHSAEFSLKAWLQAVMNIASRDPERYPKGVAGVAYRNLSAHGQGNPTDYQKTFGNYPLELFKWAKSLAGKESKTRIQILRDFDGLVKSGEMLVVLGRPGRQVAMRRLLAQELWHANKGSGCSTFLKAIAGETNGFYIGESSYLNYQGVPKETMHHDFRGECIYQAEVDAHFPQLTVSQTLDFAARARVCAVGKSCNWMLDRLTCPQTPRNLISTVSRAVWPS